MTIRKRSRRPDGTIETESQDTAVEGTNRQGHPECASVPDGEQRPDAADCAEASRDAGSTVDEAKLNMLALMQLLDWKQNQMAKFFGVSDRTIRNWLPEVRHRRISLPEGLDPQREFSRILLQFDARRAGLEAIKQDARAIGDLKIQLACVKQSGSLEKERYEFLARHQTFAGIKIGSANDQDRSAQDARQLLEMAATLFNIQHVSGDDADGRED